MLSMGFLCHNDYEMAPCHVQGVPATEAEEEETMSDKPDVEPMTVAEFSALSNVLWLSDPTEQAIYVALVEREQLLAKKAACKERVDRIARTNPDGSQLPREASSVAD